MSKVGKYGLIIITHGWNIPYTSKRSLKEYAVGEKWTTSLLNIVVISTYLASYTKYSLSKCHLFNELMVIWLHLGFYANMNWF